MSIVVLKAYSCGLTLPYPYLSVLNLANTTQTCVVDCYEAMLCPHTLFWPTPANQSNLKWIHPSSYATPYCMSHFHTLITCCNLSEYLSLPKFQKLPLTSPAAFRWRSVHLILGIHQVLVCDNPSAVRFCSILATNRNVSVSELKY